MSRRGDTVPDENGSMRPLFLTGVLLAAVWGLVFSPHLFTFIPVLISFKIDKNIYQILPPTPDSMSQAFILGNYEQKLTAAQSSENPNSELISEILKNVTRLLDRVDTVSVAQLHGVLQRIREVENETSLSQRVLGIFSFVNILWFFSILGITSTIPMVLYYSFKPILLMLKDTAIFVATLIWSVVQTHAFLSLAEVCAYFASFYPVYLANTAHPDTGFYIAFTGLMLWIPVFVVSCKFHDLRGKPKAPPLIVFIFGTMVAPVAYQYNSSFLGFITVACLYSYLGFFVGAFFGGYVIGFQDDGAVVRCCKMSVLLSVAMIVVKYFEVDMYHIRAFRMGILVMSNLVLFLALLIHTSAWRIPRYGNSDFWKQYLARQALMIVTLLLAMFFGNYLVYPAMANTAYVFAGLYLLSRVGETEAIWKGSVMFFSIFFGSIAVYCSALYLHMHPELLVNMFVWE